MKVNDFCTSPKITRKTRPEINTKDLEEFEAWNGFRLRCCPLPLLKVCFGLFAPFRRFIVMVVFTTDLSCPFSFCNSWKWMDMVDYSSTATRQGEATIRCCRYSASASKVFKDKLDPTNENWFDNTVIMISLAHFTYKRLIFNKMPAFYKFVVTSDS